MQIQAEAQQTAQQLTAREAPVFLPQCQQEAERSGRSAKQRVPDRVAAPAADGAQQIVQQTQGRPCAQRQQEGERLGPDGEPHFT